MFSLSTQQNETDEKFKYSVSVYLTKSQKNFYHQFVSEKINKLRKEHPDILLRMKDDIDIKKIDT